MGEFRGEGRKSLARYFALCFFAFFFFVLSVHRVFAASFYFSPASGSYAPGSTFAVGVYASSGEGVSVNAFSGTVSFSTDTLEVTGVSKTGSVMSLWVADPSYANSTGTVQFDGVVLNPGYTGTSAKIATITFKVKGTGSAAVRFSGGSILANDGLGTNVLTGSGTGTYTIKGTDDSVKTPEPVTGPPGAPAVSSASNPDQSKWYNSHDVSFSWPLASSVTGVNVLADHNAKTDPGTTSDGLMSRYTYSDVDDGQWYFHIRLQNEKGWGAVSHFAFNIDTVAPAPFTVTVENPDAAGAKPSVLFSSVSGDALSGLSEYAFEVNGEEVARVNASDIVKGIAYVLPEEVAGAKTLIVRAIDKAGNAITAPAVTYTVEVSAIVFPPAVPVTEQAPLLWNDILAGIGRAVLYALLILLGIFVLIAVVFTLRTLERHLKADLAAYRKRRKAAHPYALKNLKALRQDIAKMSRKLEEMNAELDSQIEKLS
jgi:hypothetical protein